MTHRPFTVASMGHSQAGKSSVLGCLATHYKEPGSIKRLLDAVEEKVDELKMPELRYALIFDLPKADFALSEELYRAGEMNRSATRTPGWLGCEIGGSDVMFVDEPGHTAFLKYIVGPTAFADLGILVVNVRAFLEDYRSIKEEYGADCFFRRVEMDGKDIPFLLKVDREQRQERIGRGHPRRGKRKRLQDKWVPGAATALVNYLALTQLFDIDEVVVAVHKMDKRDYSESDFNEVVSSVEFLASNLRSSPRMTFVPTAAIAANREEHNLITRSARTPWFKGPTVDDAIRESVEEQPYGELVDEPFRLQIERFVLRSKRKDYSIPPRIFGRVDRGMVRPGDQVAISPGGLKARVKSIRGRGESHWLTGLESPSPEGTMEEAGPGDFVSLAVGGKDVSKVVARSKDGREEHWMGRIVSSVSDTPVIATQFRAKLMIVPSWWLEESLGGTNLLYGYVKQGCRLSEWGPSSGDEWWQTITVDVVSDRPVAIDPYRKGTALGKVVVEQENFMIAAGTVVAVSPDLISE